VQVKDVMTQATVTEASNDSLRSAAESMWRNQTGSLLVTDHGQSPGSSPSGMSCARWRSAPILTAARPMR
jgi:CBS domain-containing protein